MNWTEKINLFKNNYVGESYGELHQDLFVLGLLDCMHDGYFVEFGTMDGRYASNTYLLENKYGWRGIVCEPGRMFHSDLATIRRCIVDHRAVTGHTGDQLMFKEVDVHKGLSGLVDYFHEEEHHTKRRNASPGAQYLVDTVSLNDLLIEHNAPKHINYISIDTEGSEPDILKNFDFTGYEIDVFTVEHNHVEKNKTIVRDILIDQGYTLCEYDQPRYEDCFIHNNIFKGLTK
jgi:FkbM family methyltransferase